MRNSWLVRHLCRWSPVLCAVSMAASGPALGASVVEISQLGENGRTRLVNHIECPEAACVGTARIELDSEGNRPVTVDVAVAFRRGEALITMKSEVIALDFDNQDFASIPLGPDGQGNRRITVYERSPLLKGDQNRLLHSPVIRVPVATVAKLRVKIVSQ
jgi:hypothetical protein